MRIAKEQVDVRMQVPGAVIRQRRDFGDATGYGKISGEFFTLSAGVDTTPLFEGLEGNLKPLSTVPCHITYGDGTTKTIQIKCRIDTAIEIEYIEHGGVLHYVLRDLASR